jgi:hypothetical protein
VMVTRCQKNLPFFVEAVSSLGHWGDLEPWTWTSNPGPGPRITIGLVNSSATLKKNLRGVIGMAGSICSLRRTNTRFSRRKPRKEHSYLDSCRRLSLRHHQLCSLLPFYQTHFFLIVVCVTRCQWRLTPLSRQIGLTI